MSSRCSLTLSVKFVTFVANSLFLRSADSLSCSAFFLASSAAFKRDRNCSISASFSSASLKLVSADSLALFAVSTSWL